MGMAHQMRMGAMEAAFQEANAAQQEGHAHAAMMHAQQSQMAGGGSMGAMEVTNNNNKSIAWSLAGSLAGSLAEWGGGVGCAY